MTAWYVRDASTPVGWSAVTAWSNHTATAGELIRQATTPTVGNERVFVAIVGGATGSTEPTWTVTKGAKNTSSSATYQECTGQAGVNGDLTNCPNWTAVKNTLPGIGRVIQNNAGTHLFIVSTAGTAGNGSEPTWNTTAGNTTADNSVTWTCIGVVGNFGAWAAPHARLSNAYASNWGAAGDTFNVADDHAESSTGNITLTSPGTIASPTQTNCISHTGSLPATGTTTGATITTTLTITINTGSSGASYMNGIAFNCGNSSNSNGAVLNSASGSHLTMESCSIKKNGTGAGSIQVAANTTFGTIIELSNTTLQFAATGDGLAIAGTVIWRNTSSAITGGTVPTTLLSGAQGVFFAEGVDLSGLGSGKTIVGASTSNGIRYQFANCKLNASVTRCATPTTPATIADFVSTSSSGIPYDQSRHSYGGTLVHETTVIRTGGASDGTTGISWNLTTTANVQWVFPFEACPIDIWNPTTGANVTVTLYGIWGGGAVPNSDDIWMDVEYLGSSGSPLSSRATSTKSNVLATGSALSSDSSTWGGSTTPFKMSVTLSTPQPQLAGYLRIYVRAAKASTTFYIDPKPVLS